MSPGKEPALDDFSSQGLPFVYVPEAGLLEGVTLASIWDTILGRSGEKRGRLYKYEHYLFVISMLVIIVSVLALLNGYYHYFSISPYAVQRGASSPFLMAGYIGMFVSIAFVPVPDYFLVPIYGYLSLVGIFDPLTTFLVCIAAALFLMELEYAGGRLMARPLLLKALSYFRISEKDIEAADRWLIRHGKFSIFISTFVPYFYSVTSLAAGTLRMNPVAFFLASFAGFGLRFTFLEYVGYSSINIFAPSFDYSQRAIFILLVVVSSLYVALYLVRSLRITDYSSTGSRDI